MLEMFLEGTFESWAMSTKDQSGSGAMTLRWLSTRAVWLEYAMLDGLGVLVIWFGGRVQKSLGARCAWSRESEGRQPLPLDDRAVTPL